jgi:hypothetical protein
VGVRARSLAAGMTGCAVAALATLGSGTSTVIIGPAREPGTAALVRSMQSAVRGARSVRVTGHLTQNGTPLGVDLSLSRNGDLTGTIIQNGAPAQVVAVAGKIYVRATPAFLLQMKAPGGSCAAVCGKWIQLALPDAGRVTDDLSMANIVSPLTSDQVPTLTEGGSTTVQGRPAWVLRAADGSVIDVSAGSEHYPLAAADGGSLGLVVSYSQWNKVPRPTLPAASQVLMPGGAGLEPGGAGDARGLPGTGGLSCWLCLPDRREDL